MRGTAVFIAVRDGFMRRSLYAFSVVAAVLATLVVVPAGHNNAPVNAAPGQQFTWFNQTMTHNVKKYAQPTTTAPSDWTSPINYVGGHVYLRLDVLTKPSSLNTAAQVCVWRNSYTEESCSSARTFTAPGVQWVDLGPTTGWWKKNGAFSWATASFLCRRGIMFKDVETGTLLMSGGRGTSCYTGATSLTQHVPISVHAEAIVVAAGSTSFPLRPGPVVRRRGAQRACRVEVAQHSADRRGGPVGQRSGGTANALARVLDP